MIESARRRALINEITDYKQAFLSFYCEYGRYPGDLNNLGFTGFSSGQTYNSNSFAFPYDGTDTKNNHYISDTVSGPFVDMYLAKTMEFEPQGSAESSNPALYSINTKVVPFSKILKDMFLYYELTYDEKKGNDPLYSKHKFDYVVNFAAETSVDKSFIDPTVFYESNVVGVINLATLSLKYGVKRLHQVSTDEVYGDLELNSDYKFKETDSLNPKNPYSLSKANADEFLIMYHNLTGLDVTISRSTNNFGAYQAQDKLIPLVINRALMEQEIPIFGTGKNVRDWINVLDHCKAIDLIMFNGKSGEIYNVSSHYPLTNLEVVKKILKRLNKDKSLIKFVEDRRVHDKKYAVDTTKIETKLGFKSEFDFDFSLDLTIEYYKEI